MNLQEFHSTVDYVEALVKCIEEVCDSQEVVHIALSGGNTPRPLYQALAQNQNIDFGKVEFWMIDERYVPASSEYSNQKMIRATLVDPLAERLRGFHYFDTSLSMEKALDKYREELDEIGELDVCILGIGTDGHTASLMVGQKSVLNETDLVLQADNPYDPTPPVRQRLTLGWKAIMHSRKLLLLASGEKKKQVISELLDKECSVKNFPAKRLLEHPDISIFFNRYE
ncbi:6-phosphogluconolactonase [Candidatus Nomurabacteria bacterium]|nr:6-phosphogluconolactonase [Candidatus Nomurabacteria bacterium]